jgi:acetyltransferase-like isoleucine patch superfamily enzyme
MFRAVRPNEATRWLYSSAFEAQFAAREGYELLRRLLVATPIFLSRCAVYGERIAVDRVPYMLGPTRIELGSDIRISGLISIAGNSRGTPVLKIGNGVYIGHGTGFAVASRIEIHDFASIGGGCYIADTEGHNTYNPQRPIWEVPAGDADIAPVVIENNVQISRSCVILKGVRIGARSVIGAGSVVRSDIPPDSIVMGNPARVVKRMTATAATAPGAERESKG